MVVEFFRNATTLTYASLGVAAVVGILYFRIFFRKRDEFDRVPENAPSVWDLWFGPNDPDLQWREAKIVFLFLICLGCYLWAYHQLPVWFPSLEP